MDRLLRIGGVCALLYVLLLVAALVLLGAAGLLDAADAEEILPILADQRGTSLAAGWLLVVAPIALAVTGLALHAALREAGSVVSIALLSFVSGSLLALLRNIIWLAMIYELAPAYVEAAEATGLAVLGDTLISFGYIVGDLVGAILVAGVGLPLFSVAILRTGFAPRWVAWVGLAVAITAGWFTILAPVGEVFEIVNLLGNAGFVIVMVSLGIYLWRAPQPAKGHLPWLEEPQVAGEHRPGAPTE